MSGNLRLPIFHVWVDLMTQSLAIFPVIRGKSSETPRQSGGAGVCLRQDLDVIEDQKDIPLPRRGLFQMPIAA
jgi:hypothetical protein